MKSAPDFPVFHKWLDAPSGAFGGRTGESLVPLSDKEAYWRIYDELRVAAESARSSHPDADIMILRPKVYSRDRGSRGHRPVDLWVSICIKDANIFGYMPQVYAIASDRGLEIGFAASIAEEDYFDPEVKERNRTIVPFINSKLPSPDDLMAVELDQALSRQGDWHFNKKTRLTSFNEGFDAFTSLPRMLDQLKSRGEETGGGAICRLYSNTELAKIDLSEQFELALANFAQLLVKCAPTSWDMRVRIAQAEVENVEPEKLTALPAGEDTRPRVWAEVARRQGQGPFRRSLLEAYGGKCAISGTDVIDVLQAAHIRPYKGAHSNHISNGILLRADLHNLFDLKMITVDTKTMKVFVSPRLKGTTYWTYNGHEIATPIKKSHKPCVEALNEHFQSSAGFR